MDERENRNTRRRRGAGRPTISDVARLAEVSPITVSRALREPGKVSPELRASVERAVRTLGYIPDPNARALASSRSDVIGVIIPSLTNNVFADVLKGMYDAMEASPYQIQLGNSRYSPVEEERLLATFASQRPSALIVSGIDQTPAARTILEQAGCPVVQIMETGADPIDMMVGFSHRAAGAAIVSHLIDVGYRRIGFIGARMDPRSQRRLQGYRDALEAAGMADRGIITTTPAPSSVSLGRDLLRDLLARIPDIDAVFCNNDDLAMGALFECQRSAIDVPRRLGIAGFNDLEMMAAACPALSSVRTHRYDMGFRAVGMALDAIAGRPIVERIVDLGFELAVRESTAGPSARMNSQ
jgi:LacI family transcriptional regulator, gluconate utilization system Gnt-I transcriptional repressor